MRAPLAESRRASPTKTAHLGRARLHRLPGLDSRFAPADPLLLLLHISGQARLCPVLGAPVVYACPCVASLGLPRPRDPDAITSYRLSLATTRSIHWMACASIRTSGFSSSFMKTAPRPRPAPRCLQLWCGRCGGTRESIAGYRRGRAADVLQSHHHRSSRRDCTARPRVSLQRELPTGQTLSVSPCANSTVSRAMYWNSAAWTSWMARLSLISSPSFRPTTRLRLQNKSATPCGVRRRHKRSCRCTCQTPPLPTCDCWRSLQSSRDWLLRGGRLCRD